MLSKEEEFLLYIPFYHNWFGQKHCWLAYVNGEFFRNKRNVVCIYTPSEIIRITKGKEGYFCGLGDDYQFCIVGAKLVLEGAEVKGENQYVSISQYVKSHKVHKHAMRNICLVAYRKDSFVHEENPNRDHYYYRYEICADEELTMSEKAGVSKVSFYNDMDKAICYLRTSPDKNHSYKTKLDLPIEAIPHTPGSNRMLGSGATPPIENYNWKIATGIGIVGAGNSEIRCIDIDGCQSEEFLYSFLNALGLPPNYPWVIRTGSNQGYHVWIWCESLPNNLLLSGESNKIFDDSHVLYFISRQQFRNTFNSIEVRWNAFCMLPPSVGPSGIEYSFMNGLPKEGMTKISGKKVFDVIHNIASNTTVDYASLVDHRAYGWSENEAVESIFMCFDTETTGLPEDYNASYEDTDNWPRIVQISYIIFEFVDGKIYEREKKDFTLVPEGFDIPESSTKIHRISNKDAKEIGYNRKHVLEFIARQLENVDYLVGHNVDFDINVLRCEFVRESIEVDTSFEHIIPLCTMKSGVTIYPSNSSWPKLEKLYRDLTGKDIVGAHNSLNDVMATVECFKKLTEKKVISVKPRLILKDVDAPAGEW